MTLDERFRAAVARLCALRDELLEARERTRDEPGGWWGGSVRFNQRLRDTRKDLAILVPPPLESDLRLFPLYDAGQALRDLWEGMNLATQGLDGGVAQRRLALERAFRACHDAIGDAHEPR